MDDEYASSIDSPDNCSRSGPTTAERLLAASEGLAGMGSWVLDLRTLETLWSDGMYRIVGLPPAQGARSVPDVLERVHPADRERLERLLEAVTARPEAVPEAGIEHTVRMVRADGSVCELRAVGHVEHDEAGPARWFGSVQDVTDHRLSERELEAHHTVSQALREWKSFEPGLADLLGRVATALDYPMASLWLWDAGAEALACRAFWSASHIDPGDFEPCKRGLLFREGEGKPGLAWRTRAPVVTGSVAGDPVFRPREAALARGISSAIAFPAVGPDGPVAVLSFYSLEHRVPSSELVRTLTAIGRELGRFLSLRQAQPATVALRLTPRELEVLTLAAEGLNGPAIAAQLGLSPGTVGTHFKHIREKLGVGHRAGAVALALRTGLIH